MTQMQFGLMLRAQFPRGDDMAARFRELLEQARLANQLGYASITKGMHYSGAPWQDFQHLIMSVQWPGMPQSLALEELHMLAEEVFPRVRQG